MRRSAPLILLRPKTGSPFRGGFALRTELPKTKRLTCFSSYKEIVDLLGTPTHLPIGGETDDKWAYDRVSWRLFAPAGVGLIDVVEINVDRKYLLTGVRDNEYLIESYSVSRGLLTKSGKAETLPSVTR